MATEALDDMGTRAARLGVSTEMKKWERVALKELRDGRPPADRAFDTDVIPEDLVVSVAEALEFVETEADIKSVFDLSFFRQGGQGDRRRDEGSRRGEQGQGRSAGSAGRQDQPAA